MKINSQQAEGLMQQYTNEITPEIRESYLQPPYDEELLSDCDNETRKEPEEINEQRLSRPLAHIFRYAVVWSLTRLGVVLRHGACGATTGGLQHARVGDKVVYADGSEATIISGAGKARVMQGASAALVGSMLDNGDEIISTPQSISKLAFREGDTLPEGFLTMPGSKH
jgi:uncharacterized Zn-binding protein involved in type VI secretion